VDYDRFPNPTKRIHETVHMEHKYIYAGPTRYLIPPKDDLTIPFSKVLYKRKSDRRFKHVEDKVLNELLWFAAHTRSSYREDSGFIWQHRASPSAGGRHPIDILVCNRERSSNEIYTDLYDPPSHSMRRLKTDKEHLGTFLVNVAQALDPQEGTLLWFIAQPERTISKYKDGEALILLDAGALITTVSFVAAALDLNCCAVGCTGEPWITNALEGQAKLLGITGLVVGSPS
jgi:SagB-type dehydrogenase family enzyme